MKGSPETLGLKPFMDRPRFDSWRFQFFSEIIISEFLDVVSGDLSTVALLSLCGQLPKISPIVDRTHPVLVRRSTAKKTLGLHCIVSAGKMQ